MVVKKGDMIKVHYVGKLEDGTIFDSSEGREPLSFKAGEGQVIKGFDVGVLGMEEGEKKEIFILSEDAYGDYRDDLVVSFSRDQLPDDIDFQVGMRLQMPSEQGVMIPVLVKDIQEDRVFLDANFELAGKNLIFDVELVS
jgi:peptidylprolyl isomerase